MIITRPNFRTIPLADGLKWQGGGGWRYEQKMDGVWAVKDFDGAVLAGEQMKDGRFCIFDLLSLKGTDFRPLSLKTRLDVLELIEWSDFRNQILTGEFFRPCVGNGAEFLEAVLARGGEGVVAKQLDAPFGAEWFKCKRVITLDLLVTEKNMTGTSSIRLGELNGEDRGWCPCKAAFDSVKVGDIVEVAAYRLTVKGKLREPRFVKVRHDKAV